MTLQYDGQWIMSVQVNGNNKIQVIFLRCHYVWSYFLTVFFMNLWLIAKICATGLEHFGQCTDKCTFQIKTTLVILQNQIHRNIRKYRLDYYKGDETLMYKEMYSPPLNVLALNADTVCDTTATGHADWHIW